MENLVGFLPCLSREAGLSIRRVDIDNELLLCFRAWEIEFNSGLLSDGTGLDTRVPLMRFLEAKSQRGN